MKAALGLAGALILLVQAPLAAETGPAATASGFLAVYGGFHPSDGIPDSGGRAKLAPYLSAGLNQMLAEGAAAEARFAARIKDAPPMIEGDLFTSMFEGATSWKLGACGIQGSAAHCPVVFTHAESGAPPVTWTDTLILTNTPRGWRLSDIAYGGGFRFGNTGSLTDTLKLVLSQAP
jgi:hypothetical protein